MNRVSLFAAAALAFTGVAVSATPTQLLTFEGLTTSTDVAVPNGYGGLAWINFDLADPLNYNYPVPGLFNAVVSPTYVAYSTQSPSAIVSTGGGVHFQDAYLTGLLSDMTSVEILGIRGNSLIFDQTVALDTGGPTFVTFGSSKYVDGLLFFGTTPDGQTPGLFAIDDLRTNAVPEPAAWGLMLTGFGVLGMATRRRRTVAATA